MSSSTRGGGGKAEAADEKEEGTLPLHLLVDTVSARGELRDAIPALQDRGLIHAARWAAELMAQTEEARWRDGDGVAEETDPGGVRPQPAREEVEDAALLAKTYFDLRKFRSAARVLEGRGRSETAVFLRLYSLYLAGEKLKQEEEMETSDPLRRAQVPNRELAGVEEELLARAAELEEGGGELDPFCRYLLGVVCRDLDRAEEARAHLVRSVNAWPLNWSAWKALCGLVHTRETLESLELREHWMRQFFYVDAMLELHEERAEVGEVLDPLFEQFPGSTHLLYCSAVSHYNVRDFDEAQRLFEELRALEPYRLEGMDTYSNILYVKDARGALSFLAHNAVKTDKYQAETCVVVGNLYSSKGEHEKAAVYFKRALRLNPRFVSALTLLGHELIEMHRTSAAIEAYRRAIELNPRDYRAYYGCGQAYEILQMYHYALYYFQRATELKSYDSRMHVATAECHEKLKHTAAAIRCYHRAEANSDGEGIAAAKLARLYDRLGNAKQAALYHRRVLERHETVSGDPDSVAALLFLTEYSRSHGRLDDAERFCDQLLDVGVGAVREQAQSLLREIRSIKEFGRVMKK